MKRTINRLFVLLLAAVQLVSAVPAVLAADTAVGFIETFSDGAPGELPANWVVHETGTGSVRLAADPEDAANQAVRLYGAKADGDGTQTGLTRETESITTKAVIQLRVYFETQADYHKVVNIQDNAILIETNEGNVSWRNGGKPAAYVPLIEAYEARRWYTLRLEIDLAQQRASAYVDGTLAAENLVPRAAMTKVSKFNSYTEEAKAYLLDDISVQGELPPEQVASGLRIEGRAYIRTQNETDTAQAYRAVVLDQDGKAMEQTGADWSVSGGDGTAWIDSAGVLTVPPGTAAQALTVSASAQGFEAALPVSVIATERSVLFEDFEQTEAGQLPAGFSPITGEGEICAVAPLPDGGGQGLRLQSSRTEVKAVYSTSPLTGKVLMDYDVMLAEKAGAVKVLATTGAGLIIETAGDNISWRAGKEYTPIVADYQAGVWYNLRIEADLDAQRADVFLNGSPCLADMPFHTAGGFLSGFTAYTPKGNSDVYIDNLYIDVLRKYEQVITEIEVGGKSSLSFSGDGTASGRYTAKVLDQMGSEIYNSAVVWTVVQGGAGSAVETQPDGAAVLRVTDPAAASVVLRAASAEEPSVYRDFTVSLASGGGANCFVYEDFQDLNPGEVPEGWAVKAETGIIAVAERDGEKCLEMNNLTNGDMNITKVFSGQTGIVVLEAEYLFDKVQDYHYLMTVNCGVIGMETSSGGVGMRMIDLSYTNVIPAVEAGRWYHIKIVMDTETKKYAVYVDNAPTPVCGNLMFKGAAESISQLSLGAVYTGGAKYYVDNIKGYTVSQFPATVTDFVFEGAGSIAVPASGAAESRYTAKAVDQLGRTIAAEQVEIMPEGELPAGVSFSGGTLKVDASAAPGSMVSLRAVCAGITKQIRVELIEAGQYRYYEGFEGYVPYAMPDLWTIDETHGTGRVLETADGNRALFLGDVNDKNQVSAQVFFEPSGNLAVFEARVMLPYKKAYHTIFGVQGERNDPYAASSVEISTGEDFSDPAQTKYPIVWNTVNDLSTVLVEDLQAGRWYHFKVIANPRMGTADVYVDDMETPAGKDLPFRLAADELSSIKLLTAGTGRGFFIDDVRVYDYTPQTIHGIEAEDIPTLLVNRMEGINKTLSAYVSCDDGIVNKDEELIYTLESPAEGVTLEPGGRLHINGMLDGMDLQVRVAMKSRPEVNRVFSIRVEMERAASIQISGPLHLTNPESGILTAQYRGVVRDQIGSAISGQVTWSAEGGAEIDPKSGLLTLAPGAAADGISVVCTSAENPAVSQRLEVSTEPFRLAGMFLNGPTKLCVPAGEAETSKLTFGALDQYGNRVTGVAELTVDEGENENVSCAAEGSELAVTVKPGTAPQKLMVTVRSGGQERQRVIRIEDRATFRADSARMEAIETHIDKMLTKGRDRYGDDPTPLLADGLNVYTEEQVFWRFPGGKEVIMSNFADQQNVLRYLVAMTDITGDPYYKEQAAELVHYFFDHYQTEYGLLPWGAGHNFIDLKSKKPIGTTHEFKDCYPYYDFLFEVEPERTAKFVKAYWNSHILSWNDLTFNRHGTPRDYATGSGDGFWQRPDTDGSIMGKEHYNALEPFRPANGMTFANAGSDLIYAAQKLYQYTGDRGALNYAYYLYDEYMKARDPNTKLGTWVYTQARKTKERPADESDPEYTFYFYGDRALHNFSELETPDFKPLEGKDLFSSGFNKTVYVAFTSMALSMAHDLEESDPELSAYFKNTAVEGMIAYANYAYVPEKNIFKAMWTNGMDMTNYELQRFGYFGNKGDIIQPYPGEIAFLTSYVKAYKEQPDAALWELARNITAANGYGDIGTAPGENVNLNFGTSSSATSVIFPFVNLYFLSGCDDYLEMARTIGDNYLKIGISNGYMTGGKQDVYVRFGNERPLALLAIEAAAMGREDLVDTYYFGSGGFYHGDYQFDDGSVRNTTSNMDVWSQQLSKVYLKDIKIMEPSIDIDAGISMQLHAYPVPGTAEDGELNYESTDPSVAYVGVDGMVTGLRPGTCEIIVSGGETRYVEKAVPVKVYERTSPIPEQESPGAGGSGMAGGNGEKTGETEGAEEEVPAEIPFDDLGTVEWARSAIETLYARGAISGIEERKFDPDAKVTREQFVKMAVGTFGLEPADEESGFADAEADAWYAPYLAAARKYRVINGYGNGLFGVGDPITREDMAAILYRLSNAVLDITLPEPEPDSFADSAQVADYAREAVGTMAALGVVRGREDGCFAPQSMTTRAETAVMLYRLIEVTGGNTK